MAAYLMNVAATNEPPPELRGAGSLVSSNSSKSRLRPMLLLILKLSFPTSLSPISRDVPTKSKRPEPPRGPRPDKRRAMGRIEHPLFDRGRSSTPSDLRPAPAPPPYHKKLQMFLSKTKDWDIPGGYPGPLELRLLCVRGKNNLGGYGSHGGQLVCRVVRLGDGPRIHLEGFADLPRRLYPDRLFAYSGPECAPGDTRSSSPLLLTHALLLAQLL